MITFAMASFWGPGATPRPGVARGRGRPLPPAAQASRRTKLEAPAAQANSTTTLETPAAQANSRRLQRQPIIIICRGHLEPKRPIQAERRVVLSLDLKEDRLWALGDDIGDRARQDLFAVAAAALIRAHHEAVNIGIST